MNKLYIYKRGDKSYVISRNDFSFLPLAGTYESPLEPGGAFLDWYCLEHPEIKEPVIYTTKTSLFLSHTWEIDLK